MVSRYPRGDAFTSTPEGQELHLHEDEVVIDQLVDVPYPPHLWDVVSGKRIAPCKALLGLE